MSPSTLLIFSFLLSLLDPSLACNRDVVTLPSSSDFQPSALAWDPSAQHFLIGSGNRPVISSVSDAGVVQTLIPSDSSSFSIYALAVDSSRRRLIAAFSSPATISSYDLQSPIPTASSSPLPSNFPNVSQKPNPKIRSRAVATSPIPCCGSRSRPMRPRASRSARDAVALPIGLDVERGGGRISRRTKCNIMFQSIDQDIRVREEIIIVSLLA